MSELVWDQKYSVGVKILDQQHQSLFELINEISNIKDDNLNGRQHVGKVFVVLSNYVNEHFETEEELFEKTQYPGYERHKADHDLFREKVAELKSMFGQGEMQIQRAVVRFLNRWIIEHILKIDFEYREHFKKCGIE